GRAALAGVHVCRGSPWGLVNGYILIALGVVCLSPMGLSLVNRVAPPRSRGLLMGGWFVTLSLGGYSAGLLGGYWDRIPHSQFFLIVVALLAMAAVLPLVTMPRVKAVLQRVEARPV